MTLLPFRTLPYQWPHLLSLNIAIWCLTSCVKTTIDTNHAPESHPNLNTPKTAETPQSSLLYLGTIQVAPPSQSFVLVKRLQGAFVEDSIYLVQRNESMIGSIQLSLEKSRGLFVFDILNQKHPFQAGDLVVTHRNSKESTTIKTNETPPPNSIPASPQATQLQ